ncbi:hypothetical protein AALP_AA8G150800 [Arabis alpina]|uniref:Cyclic nucleotide-binding domain-containing protein n=1 Tax=Arabis alpina TaxID=50452 RepID=A0A087G767_ARAAL|nr:hypothetical protein AALP_AA8G150800 [Arabis alpina]
MKFRTAFFARSSRVFGLGELVMDSREIAKRYLTTDFFIDVAAMLPLPQLRSGELREETLKNGRDIVNYLKNFKNVSVDSYNINGLQHAVSMKKQSSILYLQTYAVKSSAIFVSPLSAGDDQLLDAICGCLVSSLSTAATYIFREGDPVNEMLFVIRGQIESSTTNGGRSGFFNQTTLRPGDFYGEELLTWALMPNSTLNLPSSTQSVRALSEVEAFALSAEDLKFVAHQFKRLQSKKLQHAFRYTIVRR